LVAAFIVFKAGEKNGKTEEKLKNKDKDNENLRENIEIQKNKISNINVADDYLDGLQNKRGAIANK